MSTELSTRIESRIDKAVSASTRLTTTGAMAFCSVDQIMEFAKVMAIAGVAVPRHLRENVGACLGVAIQASEWQMSPFAVAAKTYVVNDRLAFEAQLVAAVILRRAPIVGRIAYNFTGDGGKRRCKTSATLQDGGGVVEYESPEFDKITTKNSPLWKADPDQQLGYFSVRAMCRRHFPDVILGIYTPEEAGQIIDIASEPVAARKPIFATPAPEPEKLPDAAPAPKPIPTTEEPAAEPPPEMSDDDVRLALVELCEESEVADGDLIAYCRRAKIMAKNQTQLLDLSMAKLRGIVENWKTIAAAIRAAKEEEAAP